MSPVSPEGWAVALVAIVAIICVVTLTRHARWVALVVVVVLLIVVFLKGTSPGGPREREEYQAQEDHRDN